METNKPLTLEKSKDGDWFAAYQELAAEYVDKVAALKAEIEQNEINYKNLLSEIRETMKRDDAKVHALKQEIEALRKERDEYLTLITELIPPKP